jgi:hypothetical protein
LLRDGKVNDAADLLRQHILIINGSLHTFPLNSSKSSRKDKADDRDCAAVFAQPAPQRAG